MIVYNSLIQSAKNAMSRSYSPYSHFHVGAALLCGNGKIYTGTNIENSSYSVSMCAERIALFEAVNHGERNFSAIAIVGGLNGFISEICPPCGVCRQALAEFCHDNFEIVLCDAKNNISVYKLSELLPGKFDISNLN